MLASIFLNKVLDWNSKIILIDNSDLNENTEENENDEHENTPLLDEDIFRNEYDENDIIECF